MYSLPQDYVISEKLLSLSDEERLKILQIGEYIYFNGQTLFADNQNEKFVYAFEQQIKEIRNSSDAQIKNHADLIKEQFNSIIDGKDYIVNSKIEEINHLKDRIKILEEENCQALSLSNKLDSLMGKGNTVDNAMKGDFGESIVSNQIQHWYQTSEIEDTSADTAKGDLLWKLNDGDFRALVEVKNVQMVRPNEIQKFERDMTLNTKDNTCNCGIFISIKTETIPNKGKFKLEFINNCPVVYVCNVLQDLNVLRFALDSLFNIQQKLKIFSSKTKDDESDTDDHFEDTIVAYVQTQYNKISSLQQNILQMRNCIQNLTQSVNAEETTVKELIHNTLTLKNEHDIFKRVESEYKVNSKMDIKESILKDMRLFREENGRMPQLSDLTHKYKISLFRDDLAFKKLKREI